uniref:Lamin n=1 Tax=Molgula oculata TaxID=27575 RepID=Q8WQ19_MOLOC|nr:Lamin [Molgula oculata]
MASQQRREKDTPLSPAVASRKHEKEQMVNLNNRMAVYVEKVRSLENENSQLTYQVSTYEETSKREVTNIKAVYENELNAMRKSYDAVCNEKAALELENQGLREKAESEKSRADALAKDNARLEIKVKDLSEINRQKEALYAEANKERNDAVKELKKLKEQLAERTEEAQTNAQLLQEETLKRIDAQNLNSTLREQIEFKEKLYGEQLNEARKKHQVRVTQIDQQVKVDFESKLEQCIIDLRDQQNMELEQYKEDLDKQYSGKLESIRRQLDMAHSDRLKGDEERRLAVSKVRKLEATISSLQQEVNMNMKKISELESRLDHEQQMKRAAVQAAEQERDAARIKLDEMEKDYADLLNIKLQLDMEINTYRSLLEEEEQRLNISPSPQGGRTRSRAGKKRKRVQKESTEIQAAKKQQKEVSGNVTTTTYTSETVTTERSGSSSSQKYVSGTENEDANKSCIVM